MQITWQRLSVLIGVIASYAVLTPLVHHVVGDAVGILGIVPVVLAAWLFGSRGGLITPLLLFPMNAGLAIFLGMTLGDWLANGGLLGHGALLAVGWTVGKQRDLYTKLAQSEASTRHLAKNLETRLNELEALNRLFQEALSEREKLVQSFQEVMGSTETEQPQ